MSEAARRPTRVIGMGCQRGCPVSVLMGLIEVMLLEHRVGIGTITALASIDSKSDEQGLLELAERLSLPLHFLSANELAPYEPQLSHRSAIAFAHTGCYGVAESAALAMASRLSGSPGKLLIPRRTCTRATFALATATSLDSP